MRIKIFWDGNSDGTSRTLQLEGSRQLVWIFVERADGNAWPEECDVVAEASRTFLWFSVGRARKVDCQKSGEESLFAVGPLPRWKLPFALRLKVQRTGESEPGKLVPGESATVYVTPTASRLLSRIFMLVASMLSVYLCWFVLTVSWEGATDLEKGLSKVAAAMAPILGVTLPWASRTLRRELDNSLSTFVILLSAIVVTVGLTRFGRYVTIVNATPATLELSKTAGKIVLEPGFTGLFSPTDEVLHESVRRALDDEAKFTDDFLSRGNYCLKRIRSSGPGADACLEFRGPHWYGKVQQKLSPGDVWVVGCKAPGDLDDDYKEEWIRSSSCKTDPEMKVVRELAKHREMLARRGQLPIPGTQKATSKTDCQGPSGEIRLRPFRKATDTRPDAPRLALLHGLSVFWPTDSANRPDSAALPIWNISGNGEVHEIRILSEKTDGTECNALYESPCWTKDGKPIADCSTLYAPSGDISATLERGTQKMANLWCAGTPAPRVFGARVAGRVSSFKVARVDDRTAVYSTFDVALPALLNWVFWCEPAHTAETKAEPQASASFRGELSLAQDFQPDLEWSLVIPKSSSIQDLLVFVDGAGRWGGIKTSDRAEDRRLFLWSADSPPAAIVKARFAGSSWNRYSDSKLYPAWSWVWTSDAHARQVMQERSSEGAANLRNGSTLDAVLDDERTATVALGGKVTPSVGLPCLIHHGTGKRIGLALQKDQQRSELSAYDTVIALKTPNCDPSRSFFAAAKIAEATERAQ